MNLRSVQEVPEGSRVILKMDLDVPMHEGKVEDTDRLKKSLSTIGLLLNKHCKIAIIGHLGRPKGNDPSLSLYPVYQTLLPLIEQYQKTTICHQFVKDIENQSILTGAFESYDVSVLENLRFYPGEEENDPQFLKQLVSAATVYVNDALAVAHRKHRSVLLYHDLPGYYGLAFVSEEEKIIAVVQNPQKPMTVILGGAKEDKLSYLPQLVSIADHICIGGKLPTYIQQKQLVFDKEKVYVAGLREDGLDLSDVDIQQFKKYIALSKTIIWAGALGYFEKEDAKQGTRAIAQAIGNSDAYTIIAGGDTEASVSDIGVEDKIKLIASGGGMLLEFLTKGTLPAWDS
jgi:phosphoglycerate kinase